MHHDADALTGSGTRRLRHDEVADRSAANCAAGYDWGDPIAGFAVTLFIVHVGYEVTRELVHRLMDGLDPEVVESAERAARTVPGVHAATVRGRWAGRTLRLEIETDLAPDLALRDADALSRHVEAAVIAAVPAARHVHCDAHAGYA